MPLVQGIRHQIDSMITAVGRCHKQDNKTSIIEGSLLRLKPLIERQHLRRSYAGAAVRPWKPTADQDRSKQASSRQLPYLNVSHLNTLRVIILTNIECRT